jgi:hypothetical protein
MSQNAAEVAWARAHRLDDEDAEEADHGGAAVDLLRVVHKACKHGVVGTAFVRERQRSWRACNGHAAA